MLWDQVVGVSTAGPMDERHLQNVMRDWRPEGPEVRVYCHGPRQHAPRALFVFLRALCVNALEKLAFEHGVSRAPPHSLFVHVLLTALVFFMSRGSVFDEDR